MTRSLMDLSLCHPLELSPPLFHIPSLCLAVFEPSCDIMYDDDDSAKSEGPPPLATPWLTQQRPGSSSVCSLCPFLFFDRWVQIVSRSMLTGTDRGTAHSPQSWRKVEIPMTISRQMGGSAVLWELSRWSLADTSICWSSTIQARQCSFPLRYLDNS